MGLPMHQCEALGVIAEVKCNQLAYFIRCQFQIRCMESQIVKQTHVLPRNFFDSFRNRWLDS